jgi:hypothetical protein
MMPVSEAIPYALPSDAAKPSEGFYIPPSLYADMKVSATVQT